jgi:hypothetical protein
VIAQQIEEGFALLGRRERRESHMDDATSDNLDRADEDILTPTVSDEAIEAGGGIESQNNTVLVGSGIAGWP